MTEETQTEVIEVPKKKRGRPLKENPYREFQDYIKEIFSDYSDNNKTLIESFINDESDRIDKNLWNSINDHIKTVTNILFEKSDNKNFLFKEYTYKSNTKWKDIDLVREIQRRTFVKDFYENDKIYSVYKGYMIYSHLKLYIQESSNEVNI